MQKKDVIKRCEVFLEITILVVAIFAFSYLVGGSFNLISSEMYRFRYSDGFVDQEAGSLEKARDLLTEKGYTDLVPIGQDDQKTPTATPGPSSQAPKLTIGKIEKLNEVTLGKIDDQYPNIDGNRLTKIYEKDGKYFYDSKKTQEISVEDLEKLQPFVGGAKVKEITVGDEKEKGFMQGVSDNAGGILKDALWAAGVFATIQGVGRAFTDDENKVNAISTALSVGLFTGKVSYRFFSSMDSKGKTSWLGKHPKMASTVVGGATAIVIFLLMYKEESEEVVIYQCNPWQAPQGGSNCEKCNKQSILPCSEYQCKSLGQSCELLNKGTDEEMCTWVNRKDVDRPIINPWEEVLLEDYRYDPDNTISPPDRGVKVVKKDSTTGCIKAFTPLSFGVTTNEPTKCKIDTVPTRRIDEMQFFVGGNSLFSYNHSQVLSLPGPNALNNQSPTLENDGTYSMYVKCIDANGNENIENFVFNFCVEKGPDVTAPQIVTTSLLNEMPIAYNQSSVDLDVYVNEPSTCKWSKQDKTYDEMENNMACFTNIFEMNAQMLYKCSTLLTGLKNRQENKFYFRCKDQPQMPENDRNVNTESYVFTLIGTQQLNIVSLEPNETIKDSTDVVTVALEVTTSAGYKDGKAFCYYSEAGNDDDFIKFFDTDNADGTHKQELYLAEGSYKYYIKCLDLGGNEDMGDIEFGVEVDGGAPIVVRVYHEENYLKIITDEKAECVYGKDACDFSFEDGITMAVVKDVEHFTDWNTNFDYYIKCQDEYGNQPLPNECSIIVRPFEIEFE